MMHVYLGSAPWNMISGTRVALNNLTSVLLHTTVIFSVLWLQLLSFVALSVENALDIAIFKNNITEWCHSKQCISFEFFWTFIYIYIYIRELLLFDF